LDIGIAVALRVQRASGAVSSMVLDFEELTATWQRVALRWQRVSASLLCDRTLLQCCVAVCEDVERLRVWATCLGQPVGKQLRIRFGQSV